MTNTHSNSVYSVSIWEAIGITLGALALILVGSAGLGWKNISDPVRSEVIAQSLLNYHIPGGSKAVLGINFGGARIALVNSIKNVTNTSYPKLQILIAKVPIAEKVNREFTTENIDLKSFLDIFLGNQFIAESTEEKNQEFCGQEASLVIEKGQKTLLDGLTKIPATQYTLKAVVGTYERQVIIMAFGEDAQQEAKNVLDNLKCIIKKS